MELKEGKYTVEKIQSNYNISRQSALNLLSKLRKQGYVQTTGGGRQKRIYTVYKLPKMAQNGFYYVVNKYSKEKLVPQFEHYTHGNYTIEHAIIDGIKIGDARTKGATKYLFNHVTNWKRLLSLSKKYNLKREVLDLYKDARNTIKCKTMPKRYLK
jgi:predicted transcriptional regulator